MVDEEVSWNLPMLLKTYWSNKRARWAIGSPPHSSTFFNDDLSPLYRTPEERPGEERRRGKERDSIIKKPLEGPRSYTEYLLCIASMNQPAQKQALGWVSLTTSSSSTCIRVRIGFTRLWISSKGNDMNGGILGILEWGIGHFQVISKCVLIKSWTNSAEYRIVSKVGEKLKNTRYPFYHFPQERQWIERTLPICFMFRRTPFLKLKFWHGIFWVLLVGALSFKPGVT